ncbi:hypothetical protein ACHAWF_004087 [Thalassiosira exigua]
MYNGCSWNATAGTCDFDVDALVGCPAQLLEGNCENEAVAGAVCQWIDLGETGYCTEPSDAPSLSGPPSLAPTTGPSESLRPTVGDPDGADSGADSGAASETLANGDNSISTEPSGRPSTEPSRRPSGRSSARPSLGPSVSIWPSTLPSESPSLSDRPSISAVPSGHTSTNPSVTIWPSLMPSNMPSTNPSGQQSFGPSQVPSVLPSLMPSGGPSARPSTMPSGQPSDQPSMHPSVTASPSGLPSESPSISTQPSMTASPSQKPSSNPSVSDWPTLRPSSEPSLTPSGSPSLTSKPSGQPSANPTVSIWPSLQPSHGPSLSGHPSSMPSYGPSSAPSELPSGQPSREPSGQPSGAPSSHPSYLPTLSAAPSEYPSHSPSVVPTVSHRPSPTAGSFLWYPDYERIGESACVDDGNEPLYMKVSSGWNLFETAEDCCAHHFQWDELACRENSFGDRKLWYPAFDLEVVGCKNDGMEPLQFRRFEGYMFYTLRECCEANFPWEVEECIDPSDRDPCHFDEDNNKIQPERGFFPVWDDKDTYCSNVGEMPAYMAAFPEAWTHDSLEACCRSNFMFVFAECMGGSIDSLSPCHRPGAGTFEKPPKRSEQWYVVYHTDRDPECVRECLGPDCNSWEAYQDERYDSYSECCQQHLWYIGDGQCKEQSLVAADPEPRWKWYVVYAGSSDPKCVQDCDDGPNCNGAAAYHDELYDTYQVCCANHLWYVEGSGCNML